MSIHEGHRQRVKERMCNEGLDGFAPHQVLELLLFYAIPRRDTNAIAHRLMERFGTFDQVMDAPVRELAKVDGMGKNAAEFLSLFNQVNRYYQLSRNQNKCPLTTIEACGEYLARCFAGMKNEAVYLLCLDAKCMVLSCQKIGEGGVNSVGVPIRKIVDMAIATNATSVVLAHNHPSGLAIPSAEDINTTVRVAQALHLVDVTLNDHVIVADGDYISFVQSGLYGIDA